MNTVIALVLAGARPSTVHGMRFDERATVIEALTPETLAADLEFVKPAAAVVAYIRWTSDLDLSHAMSHLGAYLTCIAPEVETVVVRAGCSWAIPQHNEISKAIDLAIERANTTEKEDAHAN